MKTLVYFLLFALSLAAPCAMAGQDQLLLDQVHKSQHQKPVVEKTGCRDKSVRSENDVKPPAT